MAMILNPSNRCIGYQEFSRDLNEPFTYTAMPKQVIFTRPVKCVVFGIKYSRFSEMLQVAHGKVLTALEIL